MEVKSIYNCRLNRFLQGLVEMLIHLHDSRLIAAAVTIVGGRKDRHHMHVYDIHTYIQRNKQTAVESLECIFLILIFFKM